MDSSEKTKFELIKQTVERLSEDMKDVKQELSSINSKLSDNSVSMVKTLMEYNEQMREKYLTKDEFKMWL